MAESSLRSRARAAEDDEATLASFDTTRNRLDFEATSERQALPTGPPWPSHASHELPVDWQPRQSNDEAHLSHPDRVTRRGRPNVRELERTPLDFSFLDPEGRVAAHRAQLRRGWPWLAGRNLESDVMSLDRIEREGGSRRRVDD